MRILITDDSIVSRMQLERIVTPLNYEVSLAESGEAAWEFLEGNPGSTLILLDWVMDGLSGIDLCHRIRARENGNHYYIILISGRSETDDIVEGLNSGANDYLTKPVKPAELFARLNVGMRVLALQEQLSNRILELESARQKVRDLQRILPICMYCRKVSTADLAWSDMEQYVEEQGDVELSHVICPDCKAQQHPELDD